MLDPVSSEEEFYLAHLNKSFDRIGEEKVGSAPKNKTNLYIGGNSLNDHENPNLIAIATYERSKTNSAAEKIKLMRSTSAQPLNMNINNSLPSCGSGGSLQ